jgi:circadian clock protein KaiC
MTSHEAALKKRSTGIPGLDAVTGGGLPAAGATLVLGEPGAGKTALGLQILAGAVASGGGVLVSFEESREQLARDALSFDWGAKLLDSDRWELIDARPATAVDAAGSFDLEALVAAIDAAAERAGARWIVLDGIDRLLRLEPDKRAAADQVARLDRWCMERGVSLLVTGKRTPGGPEQPAYVEGIEFLLACVLVLSGEVVNRRLNRRFRIVKYRGTAHATDELALVMDDSGLHLPYDDRAHGAAAAAAEHRVGTGVARLDDVLGGGIYAGSALLISGLPGTAKTTLAASIACAAAGRGERALYLSFDELTDRIVRNLASVGLDLRPQIESGRLRMATRDAWRHLVEEHYVTIDRLLDEFAPDCVVIDPLSALLKAASADSAQLTIERLLGKVRARGITTVLTSLADSGSVDPESTLSHASTLADTWVVLDYQVRGGERNRSLSVVKSRGSAHSNQVRELVLSADGIDLADVYEYGTEVLMGTARIQKESEEAQVLRRQRLEREQRARDLERQLDAARLQRQQAEREAERLQAELEREREGELEADREATAHHKEILRRRDASRARPGSNRGDRGDNE